MVLPAVTYVKQRVTDATTRLCGVWPGLRGGPRGMTAPDVHPIPPPDDAEAGEVSAAGTISFARGPVRSGRSQERRQSLLEAADRVVRRSGPEASMAAIAAEAG